MYRQSYPENSGFSLPANYRGNAFTADDTTSAANNGYTDDCCDNPPIPQKIECEENVLKSSSESRPSWLDLGKDELIIIGLIIFFLRYSDDRRENSDTMLIILLLLLFGGF